MAGRGQRELSGKNGRNRGESKSFCLLNSYPFINLLSILNGILTAIEMDNYRKFRGLCRRKRAKRSPTTSGRGGGGRGEESAADFAISHHQQQSTKSAFGPSPRRSAKTATRSSPSWRTTSWRRSVLFVDHDQTTVQYNNDTVDRSISEIIY
jgi:hypothetical protein